MNVTRVLAAAALTAGSLLALGPAAGAADPCAHPTVRGTDRDETLRGTAGPDVIAGRGGDDVLIGLGGDDVLCGGAGQDTLRGGDGADELHGGTDAKVPEDTDYFLYYGDTLEGGPGDDTLDPGGDSRHPGTVDALTYERAPGPVVVDLPAGTVTGDGTDTVTGPIRTVTGSSYDDTMTGTDLHDEFYGGPGGDRLDGRGGDDWLDGSDKFHEHEDAAPNVVLGGAGNDNLDGDIGPDLLRGNAGNDMIQANAGVDRSYGDRGQDGINDEVEPDAGQVVDGGAGKDYLADLSFNDERGRYQRHVVGRIDMAADRLRATYGDLRVTVALVDFEDVSTPAGDLWTVFGTDGPDDISAGFLSDPVRIHARGSRDRVFGSDQDDVIDGGPGRDTGNGWRGHDRVTSVEKIFRN